MPFRVLKCSSLFKVLIFWEILLHWRKVHLEVVQCVILEPFITQSMYFLADLIWDNFQLANLQNCFIDNVLKSKVNKCQGMMTKKSFQTQYALQSLTNCLITLEAEVYCVKEVLVIIYFIFQIHEPDLKNLSTWTTIYTF